MTSLKFDVICLFVYFWLCMVYCLCKSGKKLGFIVSVMGNVRVRLVVDECNGILAS